MIRRSLLLPLLAVLLAGCDPAQKTAGDVAALPLFDTFGDLHRDVTQSSSATMDKYTLAWFDPRDFTQRLQCGQPNQRQGCRLHMAKARGFFPEVARWRGYVFCIRVHRTREQWHAKDFVAHFEAGRANFDFLNHT